MFRGSLVHLCLITTCCAAFGGVTFTPHPGLSKPNYFTASNSRAHYSAVINGSTQRITSAKLYINGTEVWSETYPYVPGGPMRTSSYCKVMFDSTHLGDGTSATIKFDIVTNDGEYSDNYVVPVKNRYYGWQANDWTPPNYWPDGSQPGYRLGLHGFSTGSVYDGWSKADFLNGLNGKTVVYVGTHGNPGGIGSGIDESITWEEVLLAKQSHIGTGLPPYNSTGNVPIQFAHILACNTGDEGSKAYNFLHPKANIYAGPLNTENQAIATYSVYVRIRAFQYISDWWFSRLCDQMTVEAARDDIITDYSTTKFCKSTTSDNYREFQDEDVVILGDPKTRLVGVYTGNDTVHPLWHYPLP